jgi:hypothetical protein
MKHLIDKQVPSITAEFTQRRQDHERLKPIAIFDLLREEEAAALMFEGLKLHYLECFGTERLDVWTKAAHAVVDLLASPNSKIHKRSEMP